MIRFPAVLHKRRSEEGKRIRRLYKGDIGVPYQAAKADRINDSGICDCLTTFFSSDNLIINLTSNNMETELTYKEHPTKEDLLEYFSQRIRIRKMTEREAMRLMDVTDTDIDKIKGAGIAKTNIYKLAGNSIVVSCLYHIFRTLFIPNQPEHINCLSRQQTLF